VEVIHAASQAVESASEEAGSALAGAKILRASHDNDPNVFVQFGINQLEHVYDVLPDDDFVIGQTEAEIQHALESRHPAPDGLTMVYQHSFQRREPNTGWGRRQWKTKSVEGWVIAKKPICLANDIEFYQRMSNQHGAILVPWRHVRDLGDSEGLNAEGFTVCDGHGGFAQVNHNPRAIELRPYHDERRRVKKRLQGKFPQDVLDDLYAMLHTDNWPMSHPHHGVVSAQERHYTRGWGHQTSVHFDMRQIMDLLEFNLKVWKVRWWRDKDCHYRVSDRIERALWYLHGVEAEAFARRDRELQTAHDAWVEYWKDFRADPEPYSTDEPQDWPEYRAEWQEGTRNSLTIRFCRWLRAEARAVKAKMPKKPVLPKLPGRKKKKKRKKSRAKRSTKKTRPAPA
jgi:hypothetical protein